MRATDSPRAFLAFLLLALERAQLSTAKAPCPLYGPPLPKPTGNLLRHPGVKTAASALDDVFLKYIDNDNDNSTGSDHFSYSVEVFSAAETQPLWSHYWTAPNLKSFNSTGVQKVDTNTVYRIGSLTKVFTMLTFLATVGDGVWNDAITKYIPEIASMASAAGGNPIYTPDWDDITVGSLASQTSGLIRDYALLGELTQELELNDLYAMGFPPIPAGEIPACGDIPTCNRQQLFAGLSKLPPSFPPSTTPAYSDIGFTLLSYVAEKITGKDFKSLVQDAVLKPLGLNHTFVSAPDDSLGIIPGNRDKTAWAFEMAEEAATGNMYTSAGDLSALGRAIMRSTLLKPAQTRRWLKPFSFTSDPKSAVGMPWGVRQIDYGKNQSYQFVHTFNKAGSLGSYTALLAVIPDLGIGFTVLAAGDPPAGLAMGIADALTSTYVPTMMYVMRDQANTTYAGTYRFAGNSTAGSGNWSIPRWSNSAKPTALNSSLTITVDNDKPGLGVTDWVSNGTDMAFIAVAVAQNVSKDYWDQMKPSVRLYPTGLEQNMTDGGKKVAFKAVFEDLGLPNVTASFSTDCSTWVSVTAVVYGSKPLDQFIFNFDKNGNVTSVENMALRVKLHKVS